jgi:carnitine-CoA ligase
MDVNPMNISMRELLEKRARENPDKVYVIFEPDIQITYGAFNMKVNQVANALLRWGIRKGDRVGLFVKNCPEFLYVYFAVAKIGAIMVPMNTGYPPDELAYAITHSEQVLLFASAHLQETVQKAKPKCPLLKEVIYTGIEETPGQQKFYEFIHGASPGLEKSDVAPDDIISICYTSGTTARPKGVMLTQRIYILAGEFWCDAMECTPSDRLMGFFPLFHANVGVYVVMGAMVNNASAIILETFSPSQHWEKARKFGATEFNGLGSILAMLYAQPATPKDKENPVRVTINGINVGSIKEGFESRFGLTILDGYSLTECLAGTVERMKDLSTRHPKRLYCIGRAADRTEIRIVNDEGTEAAVGEVGEIMLKGPTVCRGYWKDPETTAKTIRDDWLHTGDSAKRDPEGYLYFADRKKDMIKRRGENIASAEVERALNSHPKIQESAVIGVPDIYADEEVKAYIIVKPGEKLSPEEIIEYCLDYLEPFKIPRYIEFRTSFPRPAAIPKILKTELRQEKPDLTAGCYDRGPKLPRKKT